MWPPFGRHNSDSAWEVVDSKSIEPVSLYDDPDGPEWTNEQGRRASQPSEKRVRFDAAFMSSSSSDTASEDAEIPDLFTAIDDLPAPLRSEYYDQSPSDDASEDGPWSEWLQLAAERVANQSSGQPDTEDMEVSSSEESDCSGSCLQ